MDRFPGAPPGSYVNEDGWLIAGNEAWTEDDWQRFPTMRPGASPSQTVLLAIDPGYERSAWLVLGPRGGPRAFGIWLNGQLLESLRAGGFTDELTRIVIEKVEGFGMAVGAEVFETVFWSGRFAEAAHPLPVDRIGRRAIKLHLCGQARAKDPNIRQALIDRYGGPDAIGKKASPGPLYGISKDVWSALAVAVTAADTAA